MNKNLTGQDFSNLKASIYSAGDSIVGFENSVNISVVNNYLVFNNSRISLSKKFNNIELSNAELLLVNSARVYKQDNLVVIE